MKMKKKLKKYRLLILLGILTLSVLTTTIVILSTSKDFNSYDGEYFSVNYDSSWKVRSNKDGILELIHRKSKSKLVIEETTLKDAYQYATLDDLIDELVYSISDQNKDYKLLSREKTQVTKEKSDGYKILYEDDKNQILVIVTKKGSKLRLFTYSALYEYFDMVLDSAYNIIDSYESTENKSAESSVKVKTSKIKWGSNSKIVSDLKDVREGEIANNNYKVKFSVPSILELRDIDSTTASYRYDSYNVSLYATVYSSNIYEYVNSTDGKVYSKKDSYKKNKDYSNVYDGLEEQKVDGKKRYVYKLNYSMDILGKTKNYEEVEIIYELDKSHILYFSISSKVELPIEFINNIKLLSYENYWKNIERKIEDGKLIGELKDYNEFNSDVVTTIKLKLPIDFIEDDHKVNKYSTRYYGKDYNSDYFYYLYHIKYDYMFSKEDSAIDNVKSTYNGYKSRKGYQKLKESGTINLNNRKYLEFDGGYYESVFSVVGSKDIFSNVKYLVSQVGRKYLVIEIKGNGIEISNDILNIVTNFEIKEEKEKR